MLLWCVGFVCACVGVWVCACVGVWVCAYKRVDVLANFIECYVIQFDHYHQFVE